MISYSICLCLTSLSMIISSSIHVAAHVIISFFYGLPRWYSGKESACQHRRHNRRGFNPWVRKIPWSRKWQPSPVFLPGKFQKQRSLAGYSPWGCKELDMTEWLRTHIYNILFIHLSVDGLLCCFHILTIVNSATMNMGCMYLFQLEILSFPTIYPGVGLQDHMVTLYLVF